MTDQELLEFVAKVAGVERGGDRLNYGILITSLTGRKSLPRWNPLEDMGDALKLAIDLEMNVDIHSTGVVVKNRYQDVAIQEFVGLDSNPYLTVCRAIVKCAAEEYKLSQKSSGKELNCD